MKRSEMIVAIIGGLGNQMFQYALGKSIARKRNATLKFDLTGLSGRDHFIPDSMSFFGIELTPASSEELRLCRKKIKFRDRVKAMLPGARKRYIRFDETSPHIYSKDVLYPEGNSYYWGYWQAWQYMEYASDIIEEEFQFPLEFNKKNQELLNMIDSRSSVSVHVRRGDFVTNEVFNRVHGACDVGFYKRAAERIHKSVESPQFFIFSDDHDWARKNIADVIGGHVVGGRSAGEDLFLMARCKHNIIANSSFSWWGAWLNKNGSKIVIAPERRYRTDEIDTRDLLPSEWILL